VKVNISIKTLCVDLAGSLDLACTVDNISYQQRLSVYAATCPIPGPLSEFPCSRVPRCGAALEIPHHNFPFFHTPILVIQYAIWIFGSTAFISAFAYPVFSQTMHNRVICCPGCLSAVSPFFLSIATFGCRAVVLGVEQLGCFGSGIRDDKPDGCRRGCLSAPEGCKPSIVLGIY
jgi:hypothetical protein